MDDDDNNKVLLRRIAVGEQAALQALFELYHTRIFRFIKRLIGSEAIAEEIANEVFMEVWRNAGKFEGRSKVSTWIMAIAHNRAVSALRKRQETQIEDDMFETIADTADNPETVSAKRSKGEQIRLCMERLTPEHREIIDLVYYHEKSIAEIAEIVSIPASTVKTRMFNARQKLGLYQANLTIIHKWPNLVR